MPTFEAGDIVRVPFPYTNRDTTQHRPALVVSNGAIASGMLIWVVMITSAANRSWPSDVVIPHDPALTGLGVPSVVRPFKIATIEAEVAGRIGKIDAAELVAVRGVLSATLGL